MIEQSKSSKFSGLLILAMLVTSIISGFFPVDLVLVSGILGWIAAILLVSSISRVQGLQSLVLVGIGLICLLWGYFQNGKAEFAMALSANQALLAMLASVSFLRLVALPRSEDEVEKLPTGKNSLWRTLLGIHLFGAVINLSTIAIVGDRQSRNRPLTLLQAMVLSRGFSLAALWSPFFAAMGVALTNAPGAELQTLSLAGLPVAALSLVFAGRHLNRLSEAADYRGYPIHFESLWLPGLLAVGVLVINHLIPRIPILSVISLLAVSSSVVFLLFRHGGSAPRELSDFVITGLPRMSGELLLFLSAGVLAAGIKTIADASGLELGLNNFGGLEASLFLVLIVAVSTIGIHPVISITVLGSLLLPVVSDPNLLGMMFLMGWAAGVAGSPLSGLHLAVQGRFGVASHRIAFGNWPFILFLMTCSILILNLYDALFLQG